MGKPSKKRASSASSIDQSSDTNSLKHLKAPKPSRASEEGSGSEYSDYESVDYEQMVKELEHNLEDLVLDAREDVIVQMQARIFRQTTLAKFLNSILTEINPEASWSLTAREFYA